MYPDIREQIDQIAGDHLSGATDITRRAAEVLALLPARSQAPTAEAFRRELIDVARQLAAAQPSMASLVSLINHVLLAAEVVETLDQRRATVAHTSQDFASALAQRPDRIAQQALSLIQDGSTVMTISSSSAVLAALKRARAAGRDFQVVCLESRPQREGVMLARRLAGLGIPVTLVVDGAMAYFMERANRVLFGADTISTRGLVNKIGTHALALVARAHDVPAYALAGTDKFLPARLLEHFEIEAKDPREVLDELAPPHLQVVNFYFDVTPLVWVAGVVTEDGMLEPAEVERRLKSVEVHPALYQSKDALAGSQSSGQNADCRPL